MTINSALRRFHRPSREPTADPRPEPLAVGESEADGFNCPACARPLATGAQVCPGCGTHLILGVTAKMASLFLVVGLVVGAVLGGGIMAAARPSGDELAAVPASGAPSDGQPGAAGLPTPTPLSPAEAGVPSQPYSALRQAAILDARLTSQRAALAVLLKNPSARGDDIAPILRTLYSDASFGVGLAPAIEPWPAAAVLSNDLGTFYAAIRDSAQSSLRVSVSNAKAYRAAGKRMAALLARLPKLDATAATIVSEAGLAPLVEPKPTVPAPSPSAAP